MKVSKKSFPSYNLTKLIYVLQSELTTSIPVDGLNRNTLKFNLAV